MRKLLCNCYYASLDEQLDFFFYVKSKNYFGGVYQIFSNLLISIVCFFAFRNPRNHTFI